MTTREASPFGKPGRASSSTTSHGRRGRGWEARLKVWHDLYERRGVAWVRHTSPGIKRVGGVGDTFEAVFSSKGPPDFVGVAKGRAVVFDAKDCEENRWPVRKLSDHQAEDLEAVTRAGGVAFVALRLGVFASPREWVVPWENLRGQWRAGGSVGLEELREIGAPMTSMGWLDALPGAP